MARDNMPQFKRRDWLKAVGTAGAVGLAGCGGGGDGSGGDGGGGGGDGSGGDGGDGGDGGGGGQNVEELRFAMESAPHNLDPHSVDVSDDTSVLCFPENAYETLVYFNVDDASNLEPVLASEVPSSENGLISDDGLVYEFPLREGVKFHDGGELIAEDVVFSWERAQTLGISSELGRLTDFLESIEAVDDYRVRITLNRQYSPFMVNVIPRPVAAIVSKQTVEEHGGVQAGQPNRWMEQNAGAGTGPYYGGREVTEWQSGNYIVWEKHQDYWNVENYPDIERLRQFGISELSTNRAMFARNDLDYIATNATNHEVLAGTPGLQFQFEPTMDSSQLNFTYEIPYGEEGMPEDDTVPSDFFKDTNVRLGFAYAFDYETNIEGIWNGYAGRMNNYHFPGQFGYDPNAPRYEYDLSRAEEYFKQAGYWEEGFTITMMGESRPDVNEAILLLKDSMAELNPRFEIVAQTFPESQFIERAAHDPWLFPMEMGGFLPLGFDPDPYYRGLYTEQGLDAKKSHAYELDEFSEIRDLIEQAGTEPDQQARIPIYHELQRQCHEHPAVIPTNYEARMLSHRGCVTPAMNLAWITIHPKYFTMDC